MTRCMIKGCKHRAEVFKKNLQFCEDHAVEIGLKPPPMGADMMSENDWQWLRNLESYFTLNVEKQTICLNAGRLCHKCEEPECGMARGYLERRNL